ncbi:MAG: hypothetical protein MI806_13670 [Minwuiales bacterium]|nr:hypothetical protein [Minwuiales bacterium]
MPRSRVLILATVSVAPLWFWTAGTPTAVAGRACHEIPSPPVAVNVEGRFADPILREDQSRAEISDKFGRPNVTLMGKTEIQKETEYNVQIRYFDSELSGGVCFSITMIDVVIAADPVTVYVANEHPRGTCEHRVTLEHENKHVEIERTALSRHSKRMRQQFASEDFVGTRFAYSQQDAVQQANDMIERIVHQAMADLQAETYRRHSRLDTPENYRRESLKCAGG